MVRARARSSPIAVVAGALALASVGCGRIGFDAVPPPSPLDTDAACTWSAWSAPARIASVASNADEWGPSLSADGLTLYFHSDRNGGAGGFDLYVATRAATIDPFGPPSALVQLNTASNDEGSEPTADDLTLYLESDRAGGLSQLYRATRASAVVAFGSATLVPEMAGRELIAPSVTGDGSELFFTENFAGGRRLLHADVVGGVISTPQPVTELDVPGMNEGYASVSADALELYYAQATVTADIVRATRPGRGMPFDPAVPVPGINSTGDDDDPFISRDGTTLLFASNRPPAAGADLFMSTRSCQ